MPKNRVSPIDMPDGSIVLRDHVYGHVATLTKVPPGEVMENTWLITWTNDSIGWGPMWRVSRKAAEFTVVSYVYELEATGH